MKSQPSQDLLIIMFTTASIVFMGISVLFIYIEKYLQSLLSFIIGVLFLSSSLALVREKSRYQSS